MKDVISMTLIAVLFLGACSRQSDNDAVSSDLDTFEQKNIAPDPQQNLQSARRAEDSYARAALDCINRQYPRKYVVTLQSEADLRPPIAQNPVFFGCTDWAGSIMAHWTLVRLWKESKVPDLEEEIVAALDARFTKSKLQQEASFAKSFGSEDIYTQLWLMGIAGELASVQSPKSQHAGRWINNFRPVSTNAAKNVQNWVDNITAPRMSGGEDQTAMLLSMIITNARATGETALARKASEKATLFYLDASDCPLNYAISSNSVFPHCLSEAALVGQVLGDSDFAEWLTAFLPGLADSDVMTAGRQSENMSSDIHAGSIAIAWSLQHISNALPANDPRRSALMNTADDMIKNVKTDLTKQGGPDAQFHRIAAFMEYYYHVVTQLSADIQTLNAS